MKSSFFVCLGVILIPNAKLPSVILRVNFLTLPPFLALAEQKIAAKCCAETVAFLPTKPGFQDSSAKLCFSHPPTRLCSIAPVLGTRRGHIVSVLLERSQWLALTCSQWMDGGVGLTLLVACVPLERGLDAWFLQY